MWLVVLLIVLTIGAVAIVGIGYLDGIYLGRRLFCDGLSAVKLEKMRKDAHWAQVNFDGSSVDETAANRSVKMGKDRTKDGLSPKMQKFWESFEPECGEYWLIRALRHSALPTLIIIVLAVRAAWPIILPSFPAWLVAKSAFMMALNMLIHGILWLVILGGLLFFMMLFWILYSVAGEEGMRKWLESSEKKARRREAQKPKI